MRKLVSLKIPESKSGVRDILPITNPSVLSSKENWMLVFENIFAIDVCYISGRTITKRGQKDLDFIMV